MKSPDYEAICSLKARYFRYLDTRRWDDVRGLLTDDFIGDFGHSGAELFVNPDAFVDSLRKHLEEATTIHHGHMPEIRFHGEERASGVWAMEDIVDTPEFKLHGYGHYEDEYRKVDGEWLISRTRLTRLKLDVQRR